MILLLYGREPWLVHEKLRQIVDKAAAQGVDSVNQTWLAGGEDTYSAVRDAVLAAPFIASQRLVVLRDWLLAGSASDGEAISTLAGEIPDSTILVVTEYGEPDRRRVGFKHLTEAADKVWEFPQLKDQAAVRWLCSQASQRGSQMSPETATHLVATVGSDLWTLSTELDKLVSATQGEITLHDIDRLVSEATPPDIFALVDAIGNRHAGHALAQYQRLLAANEPPLRIMAMVVRQFRLLLGAGAITAQGGTVADVAKRLHVHPFVAKKAAAQSKQFTELELHQRFSELADLDFAIKTGRREAEVALELFIAEACLPPTEKG